MDTNDIYDEQLKKEFFSRFIFASSFIEGIRLKKEDIDQMINLMDRKEFLKNTKSSDLLQAYGQMLALEKIEKWVKIKKPLSVGLLLKIHKIVFEVSDENAGNFRSGFVRLRSSGLMPSFPYMIKKDMEDFEAWLKDEQKNINFQDKINVVEFVSKIYHEITRIHPFIDGNGRSARLFANLVLRKNNLPHIFIPKVIDDKAMRRALREADMGNMKPLNNFIEKLLDSSLKEVEDYWDKKLKAV